MECYRWYTYLSNRNAATSASFVASCLASLSLKILLVLSRSVFLAFVAPSLCFRLLFLCPVVILFTQLYSTVVSAPEAQGNRSARGRGCPLSAREMIDSSLTTPPVSDWLFLLLIGRSKSMKRGQRGWFSEQTSLLRYSQVIATVWTNMNKRDKLHL